MFNQYPYLNINDLNLDYILKAIKEMRYEVTNFVSINAIKYADPIQWNITSQYEKNTIVIDPVTGTAYISVAPVPAGVALTRTEYWTVVFDLGSFVTRAAQNFTSRWESDTTTTATFPTSAGNWLVWGDVLYKALSNIIAGDTYIVGSNIEHFTIEDLYTEYLNTIADIMAMVGDITDLQTSDTSSIVAAINSVLNDLNGRITDEVADINATINALPAGDWINVKKPPVPYVAAVGDGIADDTAAIQALIDAFGGVFFPQGVYRLTDSLDFENKTLMGENMMTTILMGDITDPNVPIIKAGRTCIIKNLLLRFKPHSLDNITPIYTGYFVGIYLAGGANHYSLQRGSIVQNVRIDNVGTGIYDDNNGAFSGTYDTIEITNFYAYGFASRAMNTGNVYRNIYISNIDDPTRQVYGSFGLYGINTAGVIEQMNIEHVQSAVPMVLENCTDLFVAGLHFEGCCVTNNFSGVIAIKRSNIVFESVEFFYTRILQGVTTFLFHLTDAGNPYTTLPHSDVSRIVIKNLVCNGLNMPDPTIFPNIPNSQKTLNTVSLYFIFRDGFPNADYVVDLENYTWATTSTAIGNDDSQKYIDFQCWNPACITFEKLGQLPTYGATADRPTKRLCAYHTRYFDTDLGIMMLWNGSAWVEFCPVYDGTMPTYATADRPASPNDGYYYYDTTLEKIIPYYGGSYRDNITMPVMATADRPTSPPMGYCYYDTDLRCVEVYIGYYIDSKLVACWIGTTAQRPSGIPNGFLYYDTTINKLLVRSGANWVSSADGTVE